jgi:diadenosine tetraphosphate (Ap4A) HIT family hydrolase
MSLCPFCHLASRKIIAEDELTATFFDEFPVSPGHTLIIPKKHVSSLFLLEENVQIALLYALNHAKTHLTNLFHPDGFNVGINDGSAAGQTVMHLHIHLIPRYHGDCPNPRGGIRWIFPDKAVY